MARYVLGITGASGIILAYRTLEALTRLGHTVHIVMSKDACLTAVAELDSSMVSPEKMIGKLSAKQQSLVVSHKIGEFTAPIASGTFPVDGTVVIPCSMATLAAIAMGLADNLIRRAADVALKERKPLVIVPREAPFSAIHLENMLAITRMGGIIMPPLPAWYTRPKNLDEVEEFIVGRTLDALRVSGYAYKRWE